MKKFIVSIVLFPLSLLASQILSYNIYDRSDRVDVMITFDTPYHGTIKQSHRQGEIIIKLLDASIESAKIKKINSPFLRSLTITPLANKTQIVAKTPADIKLMASKTADGYGLRLRFVSKNTQRNQDVKNVTAQNEPLTSDLPTKKEKNLTSSYIIVVILLLAGIALLFYIRKKIPHQKQKVQNSWLFQPNQAQKTATTSTQHATQGTFEEVSIRFQKPIDEHNSVVMIDFGTQSYLVLMGNGNILLDKFVDDKPTTQQEFDSILQNRHDELEAFLAGEKEPSSSSISYEAQEALQAYKEKASSSIYD